MNSNKAKIWIVHENMHGSISQVEPSTIVFHILILRNFKSSVSLHTLCCEPYHNLATNSDYLWSVGLSKSYLHCHCSNADWQLVPWCIHYHILSPTDFFSLETVRWDVKANFKQTDGRTEYTKHTKFSLAKLQHSGKLQPHFTDDPSSSSYGRTEKLKCTTFSSATSQ